MLVNFGEDIVRVINAIKNAPNHIRDNFFYIKPEFVIRPAIFETYLNKPSTTSSAKEPKYIYHYNFVNGGYEKNHFTEAENVEYLKKYPNARLYSKSKHPINDD
jgi:hypothetical protein